MPSSDTYMELSGPPLGGHTTPVRHGAEHWAFEVATFKFGYPPPPIRTKTTQKKRQPTSRTNNAGASIRTHVQNITISSSSTRRRRTLFLACCKNKIHWAIVSVRGTGEETEILPGAKFKISM